MSDVVKRISIEGDADGFVSAIERARQSIDKFAGESRTGEALGAMFDEALEGAKNFEEVLERVKQGIKEANEVSADYDKRRKDIQDKFSEKIDRVSSTDSSEVNRLSRERDRQLKEVNIDERADQEYSKEFNETGDKLIKALEQLKAEYEKQQKELEKKQKEREDKEKEKVEGGGEGGGTTGSSYLGRLRAERDDLVKRQGEAPDKKTTQALGRDIRHINREIADAQGGGGWKGMAGNMAGEAFGSMSGVSGGALMAGGAMAAIALLLKQFLDAGMETTRAVEKATMVSPYSINKYGVTDANGRDYDPNITLGMSNKEFAEYFVQSSRNRGVSDQYSGVLAYRQAAMERIYGLDQGSVGRLDRFNTRDQGTGESTSILMQFLKVAKDEKAFGIDRDDFSQFQDRLEIAVALNRQRSQTSEKYDTRDAFAAMLMGKEIGGSFSDRETQQSRLSGLNNMIANPDNDFKRAFIYKQLKDKYPNLSTYELIEQMEKGTAEGNLEAVMSGLQIPNKNAPKSVKESFFQQVRGLTGVNSNQIARTLGEAIIDKGTGILDQDKYKYLMESSRIKNETVTDSQGRGMNERLDDSRNWWDEAKGAFKEMFSDLGVNLTNLTSAINENTKVQQTSTENGLAKPQ